MTLEEELSRVNKLSRRELIDKAFELGFTGQRDFYTGHLRRKNLKNKDYKRFIAKVLTDKYKAEEKPVVAAIEPSPTETKEEEEEEEKVEKVDDLQLKVPVQEKEAEVKPVKVRKNKKAGYIETAKSFLSYLKGGAFHMPSGAYNYLGPGTPIIENIKNRVPAYNSLDQIALEHDISYRLISKELKDKKRSASYVKRLTKRADEKMLKQIELLKKEKDSGVPLGDILIAENMIRLKKWFLPSETFAVPVKEVLKNFFGFGSVSDIDKERELVSDKEFQTKLESIITRVADEQYPDEKKIDTNTKDMPDEEEKKNPPAQAKGQAAREVNVIPANYKPSAVNETVVKTGDTKTVIDNNEPLHPMEVIAGQRKLSDFQTIGGSDEIVPTNDVADDSLDHFLDFKFATANESGDMGNALDIEQERSEGLQFSGGLFLPAGIHYTQDSNKLNPYEGISPEMHDTFQPVYRNELPQRQDFAPELIPQAHGGMKVDFYNEFNVLPSLQVNGAKSRIYFPNVVDGYRV